MPVNARNGECVVVVDELRSMLSKMVKGDPDGKVFPDWDQQLTDKLICEVAKQKLGSLEVPHILHGNHGRLRPLINF